MFWIIFLVVLIVICAIFWKISGDNDYGLCILVCSILLGLSVGALYTANQQIYVFQEQKAYIESHISDNALEDAALTQKKVELNDWLYNVQYNEERLGIFIPYPKTVLDLEPIQ